MTSASPTSSSDRLPVKGSLTLAYSAGLAVALLIIFASAIGLAYQPVIYPSNVLRTAFVPSDGFSLVQASISGQPIDGPGLMVVLGMAGLCLGPFAFFARAAGPRRGPAPA